MQLWCEGDLHDSLRQFSVLVDKSISLLLKLQDNAALFFRLFPKTHDLVPHCLVRLLMELIQADLLLRQFHLEVTGKTEQD